ncbi:MAG: Hsp20/alpha crystallin family protein [Deltaproteobacteria bacterium]|nr:Hsp20/alpha crystallin family protein [Deltaproteobacteria bacterium]MBW2072245.1 Hsp20/alpha crystallin family protein [Deltaproteobacteria bacterium]
MFELVPWIRRSTGVARPEKDLFDWFLEDFDIPTLWKEREEWVPAFDVSETEEDVIVRAELPGMNSKDIDISLTGDVLTIRGEKKRESEDKRENYHRKERTYGVFMRSFRLPVEVKNDAVDANYKDGVLTITLPKAEKHKPRRIKVAS